MVNINIGQKEIIHFIGIGGIGMSGLAQIMKTMNFKVQGSDLCQNKNTDNCKKLGVKTDHFIERVLQGGTIVLNKTMNEINSKASEVTGRVNNNMIILKVD